jgi:hypothetical protein
MDMQRIFSEDGPWPTPWMARVLPVIKEIVERHLQRTVFSMFITPAEAGACEGRQRGGWRAG